MTTYARLETKVAELASDFGRDLATRWFSAEIVASLPTYVRGSKAGLPKGWLIWEKAVSGGWDKGAGVVRPNDILRIRIAGNRYASALDDSVLWYKVSRASAPGPCNAARADGPGRDMLKNETFENGVVWLIDLADEHPEAFEAAVARGLPTALEAKRRMSA
jgi:hypothetical protein